MKPEEAETSFLLRHELRNAERNLALFQLRRLERVPGLEDLTVQQRAERLWADIESLTEKSETSDTYDTRSFTPARQSRTGDTGQEYRLWFVLSTSEDDGKRILSAWCRKESENRYSPAETEELNLDEMDDGYAERALTNLEWSFVAYQEARAAQPSTS